jgi:hypothetical protein
VGVLLLFTEEFELVIMIAVPIEEMGRTEIPDLRGLQGEPWLVGTVFFN